MAGSARLIWVSEKRPPFALDPSDSPIGIGRRDGNDLVLNDTHVSAAHAKLEAQGGRWILVDSSTNGTRVCPEEGRPRVLEGTARALHHGDLLIFGNTKLRFSATPVQRTPAIGPNVYVGSRPYEVLTILHEARDGVLPSNREIAAMLHVKPETVSDHISLLLERLEIPPELTQGQRRLALANSWSRATPTRGVRGEGIPPVSG